MTVTNSKMHIASNMFLRYIGSFVGSCENLLAYDLKSSNVTIAIKNADETDRTGFGIGGVIGRAKKLTVIQADVSLKMGSTAEDVLQMVGSVVGVLLDDPNNFAVIKGIKSNVSLNLPYANNVFLGTVGTASN